jgi:hypothetical protein
VEFGFTGGFHGIVSSGLGGVNHGGTGWGWWSTTGLGWGSLFGSTFLSLRLRFLSFLGGLLLLEGILLSGLLLWVLLVLGVLLFLGFSSELSGFFGISLGSSEGTFVIIIGDVDGLNRVNGKSQEDCGCGEFHCCIKIL